MSAALAQATRPDWTSTPQLTAADFTRVAAFVESKCGIHLTPAKATMVEGRLRRRLIATGCATFAEYCDLAMAGGGTGDEAVLLINAITTNKTDFFRSPEHFAYLEQTILPGYAERGEGPLKIWSAACSTGAEPYTIGMVMEEWQRQAGGLDYSLLATDISTQVLAAAEQGIYAMEMIEPVPPDLRRRYLLRSKDRAVQQVRIRPELRAKIHWKQLNLMDARYDAPSDLHLLFCRNVLIYFTRDVQTRVLGKLCQHIRPGGYLFLGHSETLWGSSLPLKQVNPTIYRRL